VTATFRPCPGPSSGLVFRPAASGDAAGIASLHLASYKTAYRCLLPSIFLAALDPAEREMRWREHLADPSLVTFLAEAGGSLVGFTGVGPSRDLAGGELRWLHVAREWWGRGVGAALHERAVAALGELGHEVARLWVVRGNTRAIAFYRARGWRADGRTLCRSIEGVAVHTDGYTLDHLPGR
jgi:GNAT superfamily N-acetyltransferase